MPTTGTVTQAIMLITNGAATQSHACLQAHTRPLRVQQGVPSRQVHPQPPISQRQAHIIF